MYVCVTCVWYDVWHALLLCAHACCCMFRLWTAMSCLYLCVCSNQHACDNLHATVHRCLHEWSLYPHLHALQQLCSIYYLVLRIHTYMHACTHAAMTTIGVVSVDSYATKSNKIATTLPLTQLKKVCIGVCVRVCVGHWWFFVTTQEGACRCVSVWVTPLCLYIMTSSFLTLAHLNWFVVWLFLCACVCLCVYLFWLRSC